MGFKNKKALENKGLSVYLAEAVRFELTEGSLLRQFSSFVGADFT